MLKKDYVKAISVYDKKGTIVYSTAKDAIGRNYSKCDFFQWATRKENKGRRFISSLIRATENQTEQVPYSRFLLATPVYQEARDSEYSKPIHKFVGVVAYTIDLEEVIAAFLPLDSAKPDKRHVWIIDKYINQAQSPKLRIAA